MTTVETHLDLPLLRRGKVRDVYDLGSELLIVATDRISAFDYVLPTPIPDKGSYLTRLSIFWFDYLKNVVPTHFITNDVTRYPKNVQQYRELLDGRSMLVKKAQRVDIECIVRGYIAGSGWKEYKTSQSVCGIQLPKGLRESEKLPEAIFTPSTKADDGSHDINISEQDAARIVGQDVIRQVKRASIALYTAANAYANTKGIIIADTKFEFGFVNGELTVIDEVLTPDSSRFWDVTRYTPGTSQDSFDKQYVRDYLERIAWNKQPPVPSLPPDVVANTQKKYREVCDKLALEANGAHRII